MYKECLKKISSYELRNQIEQLLNYSPNFFTDNRYCIGFMLSVFSKLFEQYTNRLFCFSIDNSVQCILYPNIYSNYIKSLSSNNKNSFIIAPLLTQGHLFSCIILKTDTTYECTLVNKGFSDNNPAYIKYTISEENMENILPHLGLYNNNILSTGEVYNLFSKYCISSFELKHLHSSYQTVNNCYYKELEAGLKYAYSNCYIDNFSIPKWPVSTLSMHQQYISLVMSLDISSQTLRHLKNLYDVYTANKTFRDCLNSKTSNNFKLKFILPTRFSNKDKSYNYKLANFNYFKSSFGYTEESQSTFEALYKCLCLVDLKTMKQNLDFFGKLCEEFKLEEHLIALNTLKDYVLGVKSGLSKIAPSIQTFFPNVIHELTLQYSGRFDTLGDVFYKQQNWTQYKKCLDASLELYPHNTLSLSRTGDFYFMKNDVNKAIEYFSKSLNLIPKSELLLEKRTLSYIYTKNFKKALQDLSKLEEINPNNGNLKPLKDKCKEYITKNDISPSI